MDGQEIEYNYDVFFSFSPQDFLTANYLYTALRDAGFCIVRDGDVIERSTDIDSEVKNLIDRSKISVILLSKNYVSSRWFLDQLVKIIESKKILPVFCDMDPSEVSSQNERTFEDQLNAETNDGIRNSLMKDWSEALSFAANVHGLILPKAREEESSWINGFIEAVELNVAVIDSAQKEAEAPLGQELNEELSRLSEDCTAVEIILNNIEELPENPNCPSLIKLHFRESNDLTEIPDSFFESMPCLQILDLSDTSIKTLPRSIACLVKLQELYVKDCLLLTEMPPEIGELRNLEVFDLEGTELGYLPTEVGRLVKLKSLKFSLSRYADEYIKGKGIKVIIPEKTLSKFYELKELSILVDPDCEWWDAEVETVIDELNQLRNVTNLKLYFPTPALLEKISKLHFRLANFTLTVGRHESSIISCVPRELRTVFQKRDNCLIYVNGKEITDGIESSLKWSRALFLDRQWTMKNLTELVVGSLEFCLIVECNEMKAIVDGNELYQELGANKKPVLRYIRYLSVHYMKNLQCIWRGPIISPMDFCSLEIIALHTCPELTTIFSFTLLSNLVLLKELIVENCAKVKSLVSADLTGLEAISDLLPFLKKILLIDLPELASISGGLQIGPRLESIVYYNCPMLKNLSAEEMMYEKYMHEIKDEDESEWFNELETTNREIAYLREFGPFKSYEVATSGETTPPEKYQLNLASAKKIILRWDSLPSKDARDEMIFNSDRKEISLYLQAVDEIQWSIQSPMIASNQTESNYMIQIAMARLECEFRNILITCTNSDDANDFSEDDHSADGDNFSESTATSWSDGSSYTSSYALHGFDLKALKDINDLRSIAKRMLYAGYIQECVQVYFSVRESVIDLIFKNLVVGFIGDVDLHKLEWEVQNKKIGQWIRAAKVCVNVLLPSEKNLCEKIFKGLGTITIDDDCFVETIIGPANQLFNFAEAINFTPLSTEKLFKILDLHDALSDLMPAIDCLFSSRSPESNRVRLIRSRLAEFSRKLLSEFGHLVLHEASSKIVPGGSIHPLSRYVMNYTTLLSDYSQTLAELIVSKPEISSSKLDMSSSSHVDHQSNHLNLHLILFINNLRTNLEEKSKQYVDTSLANLHMMNNVHYIVQKIKGSPKLREIIGETYLSTLSGAYKKAATGYLKSSWVRILSCLSDESGGSHSLGQVSKSDFRTRVASFNAMFDKICNTQAAWSVPDSQLKEELRISISQKLIPTYELFLNRFKRYIETRKHHEDYNVVLYSINDLECALSNLFEGIKSSQFRSSN